jgi:hypothetical protein
MNKAFSSELTTESQYLLKRMIMRITKTNNILIFRTGSDCEGEEK